jgi:hypothetical protein
MHISVTRVATLVTGHFDTFSFPIKFNPRTIISDKIKRIMDITQEMIEGDLAFDVSTLLGMVEAEGTEGSPVDEGAPEPSLDSALRGVLVDPPYNPYEVEVEMDNQCGVEYIEPSGAMLETPLGRAQLNPYIVSGVKMFNETSRTMDTLFYGLKVIMELYQKGEYSEAEVTSFCGKLQFASLSATSLFVSLMKDANFREP